MFWVWVCSCTYLLKLFLKKKKMSTAECDSGTINTKLPSFLLFFFFFLAFFVRKQSVTPGTHPGSSFALSSFPKASPSPSFFPNRPSHPTSHHRSTDRPHSPPHAARSPVLGPSGTGRPTPNRKARGAPSPVVTVSPSSSTYFSFVLYY